MAKRESTSWIRGVGGWSCYCCGPKRTDRPRARRTERRVAKQRLDRELRREARNG